MATDQDQPYVGPRPFERDDAPRFFGRARESRDLLSLVIAQSEILLFSPSGAGKTSLLNAGLIQLLKTRHIEALPTARVRPQHHEESDVSKISNIYVFNVLTGWAGSETHELAAMSLADYLKRREHRLAPDGEALPRVVIFDQFEELFTFHPERAGDRENFFEQVRDALEADGLLRVIFVMREEFIAELEPYADILPDRLSTRYRLEQLRRDAAIDAVTGPLKNSKFSCEPGVADRLVDELLKVKTGDASGKIRSISGEYVEPVQLQVVCENLWRNLPPNVTEITEDHRRKYGDVDFALEQFYRKSIAQTQRYAGVSRRRLRKWFSEVLITEGTRNAVRLGKSKTGGIPNRAVQKLEELHLIRSEEKPGRGRWYELTHDRLIEPIQRANQAAHRAILHRRLKIGLAGAAVVLVVFLLIANRLNTAREVNASLATGYKRFSDALYNDALKSFQSAAQMDPSSYKARSACADAYAYLGNTEQAIAEFRKASVLQPNNPYPYLRIGDLFLPSDRLKAKGAYEEALKIDDKSAGAHLGLGDVFYLEGDFKQAVRHYEAAKDRAPDHPEPLLRLGEAYLVNRDYENAAPRFNEAIDKVNLRNETVGRAYAGMGFLYLEQGEYDLAQAQFNRAIATDSQAIRGYQGLATSYYYLRNYQRGIEEYQRAISRFEKGNDRTLLSALHNGLGYSYLIQSDTFPEYLEQAADECEKALALNRDVGNLFNLGVSRASQGRMDGAQRLFEEAWTNCPQTNISERLNHAVIGAAAGQPGSVEELENILNDEKPPFGLLDGINDDAKLLVRFDINRAESERLVELLEAAINAASPPRH